MIDYELEKITRSETLLLPKVDLRVVGTNDDPAEIAKLAETVRKAKSFDRWWREYGSIFPFIIGGLVIGEIFGIGLYGFAILLGAMAAVHRA